LLPAGGIIEDCWLSNLGFATGFTDVEAEDSFAKEYRDAFLWWPGGCDGCCPKEEG
jgi:hypothetical protein